MTAKEIIRKVMIDKGFSQASLAEACGMKHQSNVTGVLNRGTSLRVDVFEQMINAMGYEIVVRPIGSSGEGYVVHEERNAQRTTPGPDGSDQP